MSTDPAALDARLLDARLLASWEDNAAAWTDAVRNQRIPSRRAGTDAAILAACERYCERDDARTILDVGCGEGWLARALAAPTRTVLGIDGSADLIAHATAAGSNARFEVIGYDALATDASVASGPWDLIVCNFALLGDPLVPLLSALSQRLAPSAVLLVQTVHPWMAMGEGRYANEWREENFQGFGVAFPSTMPWYYRTLGSWLSQVGEAGLVIRALDEPAHTDTGRPLSMLLHCARAAAAR